MSDPRNFLFNTDYPVDQAVYVHQGSGSLGTGGTLTIPHGLPFIPNVVFYWSFNSDFSIVYDQNVGPFPSGNPGFFFTLQVDCRADATNIYLDANGTLSPSTVYYRLFAYQPSDSNVDLDGTANEADNFTLNTDQNYTKLVTYDKVTVAPGSTSTIPHDLGYIPQVQVWSVYSGTSICVTGIGLNGFGKEVEITSSDLIITNNDFLTYDFYYRIYADA